MSENQNKLKNDVSTVEQFSSLSENTLNYPSINTPTYTRNLPLKLQQEKLMDAYIKNDDKYIYKFDDEALRYREHKFVQPMAQFMLASLFYLASSNYGFYKFIARNNQFDYSVKLGMFLAFNILPQSYFAYKGITVYNNTNEYLYNKYLKNQQQ